MIYIFRSEVLEVGDISIDSYNIDLTQFTVGKQYYISKTEMVMSGGVEPIYICYNDIGEIQLLNRSILHIYFQTLEDLRNEKIENLLK